MAPAGRHPPIRWRSIILALVVAAPAWLPTPLASSAEAQPLYRWTDAGGVVRYTPVLESIPEDALPGVRVLRRDPFSGIVAAFRWGSDEPLAAADPVPEITAPVPPREATPVRVAAEFPEAPAERPAPAERRLAPQRDEATEVFASDEAEPQLFAIQLRATSVSAWLRPLDRSGLLAGRRLYRIQAAVEGRVWERLRLGFFATQGEARAALAQIQTSFPGGWVDRVDTAERSAATRFEIRPTSVSAAEAAFAPAAGDEGQGFAIQLDAWSLDEGLRTLTRLDLLGRHRLYRVTADVNGAVWERLRLGFFPNEADARAVLDALEGSFPGAFVARVEPDERIAFAGTTLARAR